MATQVLVKGAKSVSVKNERCKILAADYIHYISNILGVAAIITKHLVFSSTDFLLSKLSYWIACIVIKCTLYTLKSRWSTK